MVKTNSLFLIFIILWSSSISATQKTEKQIASQLKNVQHFIDYMVDKHQFDKPQLYQLFDAISLPIYQPRPATKKKPKAKKTVMSWQKYRALFLTEQRIKSGVDFYHKNQQALKRANEHYGVPIEIIIAILGIETNYGRNKGKHPVLYTLTNKAFNGFKRAKFYRKELENYLLLAYENQFNPLEKNGSYAGAMGYPQFIASSIKHYAVDFDDDNQVDLFTNPIDSIGSIGNYLHKHRWQRNKPIAYPLEYQAHYHNLASEKPKRPKYNASQLRKQNIEIGFGIPQKQKSALIALPQEKKSDYWLIFWNFYAITRYNHDNRYAMAVFQLSQAIKTKLKEYL